MLEIVDAFLGADGGKKFGIVPQNSDAMPQISLI
jgi:hypothetical protein